MNHPSPANASTTVHVIEVDFEFLFPTQPSTLESEKLTKTYSHDVSLPHQPSKVSNSTKSQVEGEPSLNYSIPKDDIIKKLDENTTCLHSYQKYIQGTTLSPKRKSKHSDHASKKSAKKKKRSKPDQPPFIPSPHVSEDNIREDLEEPTYSLKSGITSRSFPFLDSLFQAPSDYVESSSPSPVSPACFQSDIEGPSNHVSLDYDSLEDDDQDGEKKSKLQDLPIHSPVQDNQDENTPMQTIDIPSNEGLIVDDERNDMSIVLHSKANTRTHKWKN
ncbi:unnamed protein product [Lactuca virosa]|uniref:Uncharacterized protein n=1 Tax=Lactuca virosa TaxID=75947 RepID=A0AAU9PH45_9ASTR|nr:unnamed protein product [Lactuca virosa]